MLPTAVVFPGQGSQSVGMLADVLATEPLCKQVFERASDYLALDMLKIITSDDNQVTSEQQKKALNTTAVTQPLMLTAGVAIWQYLAYHKYTESIGALAGHSLGEYTALVAAGVLNFEDALRLVRLRGELMEQAVQHKQVAMSAVLGLAGDRVAEITQEFGNCYAVNFNSQEQTVIAGFATDVDLCSQACKAAGAKKVLPVAVSVPSHCSLMDSAQQNLASALLELPTQDARLPIYQNMTATAETSARLLMARLLGQLSRPVLWLQTIQNMQQDGISRFVECGSGRVLAGIIKRIDATLTITSTDTPSNLAATAALFESS